MYHPYPYQYQFTGDAKVLWDDIIKNHSSFSKMKFDIDKSFLIKAANSLKMNVFKDPHYNDICFGNDFVNIPKSTPDICGFMKIIPVLKQDTKQCYCSPIFDNCFWTGKTGSILPNKLYKYFSDYFKITELESIGGFTLLQEPGYIIYKYPECPGRRIAGPIDLL